MLVALGALLVLVMTIMNHITIAVNIIIVTARRHHHHHRPSIIMHRPMPSMVVVRRRHQRRNLKSMAVAAVVTEAVRHLPRETHITIITITIRRVIIEVEVVAVVDIEVVVNAGRDIAAVVAVAPESTVIHIIAVVEVVEEMAVIVMVATVAVDRPTTAAVETVVIPIVAEAAEVETVTRRQNSLEKCLRYDHTRCWFITDM